MRAAQQRLVLAVLLLEAGCTVSADRLVEEIWGDRRPRAALNTVRRYISQLRRLLGPAAVQLLVTSGSGYQVLIEDEDLDVSVFQRLLDSGTRCLAENRIEEGAEQLSQALELWTGAPLADVPESPTILAEVTRLNHARHTALEAKLGADLDLGRHIQVLDELQTLVNEHPLREGLRAHLMVCLYRCGRRAEALEVYRTGRALMVDELGIEPGPDLRRLEHAVLRDDPALAAPVRAGAPPVTLVLPAQLPASVSAFTGRKPELRLLDNAAAAGRHAGEQVLVISAIAGTAGVGKTALAVHWAHRVRDQFPDGQLYLNLQGYASGPPITTAEALARLLRALGVPDDQVPPDVDEASALFRSLLAGKRVLVLLDNVADPQQVRPLLPGNAGCLALVTSRDRLGGLVARDGATLLILDVLTASEAFDLLTDLLGEHRVRTQRQAVTELARLCGNLPLALRLAAANLVANPHTSITAYVEALRQDRLGGLEIDGDPRAGLRATFHLSYANLPADCQRMFRLLGTAPGGDIATASAAALALVDTRSAARLLRRLAAAHLIQEHRPGRYTVHDLLRAFAIEQARLYEPEPERNAALERLYSHYQRHVDAAARVLSPEMLTLPPAATDSGQPTESGKAAVEWLDAERSNVVAAIQHTAAHGPRRIAYRLAAPWRAWLFSRGATTEWEVAATAGLATAEAEGDQAAMALAQISLGLLHSVRNQDQDAIDSYRRAAANARAAGWRAGESAALDSIGGEYMMRGQLAEAADHCAQALTIRHQIGWTTGQASVREHLGLIYWGLGNLPLSAEHLEQAAASYREHGLRTPEARANSGLGITWHGLGRLQDALTKLSHAVTALQEVGDRYFLTATMAALAEVYTDTGDLRNATNLAGAAVDLARELGDRFLECGALAALGYTRWHNGEQHAAVDILERATSLAQQLGDPFIEADNAIRLATVRHGLHHRDAAADLADHALDRARQGRYRLLEGQALTVRAAVHLAAEELDSAADLATQAQHIHQETGHRLGQTQAHLIAGGALSSTAPSEARTHLQLAHTLLKQTGADPKVGGAIVLPRAQELR